MPQFSVTGYDDEHFKRTEAYVKKVRNIYNAAIRDAARLGVSLNHKPEDPFFFKNFPGVKKRMEKLFEEVANSIQAVIEDAVSDEWEFANDKNDDLVKSVLKTDNFNARALARLLGRNREAKEKFAERKSGGLGLSDRVWNNTKQFRSELEMGLELGIAEGKSADQISRDIRQYLENPDKLFRRVRDERGVLRLSQHAKEYKPGQGVYRSSYKNAMRVARSETNMAYRTADNARWQTLDFIVGYEVRRSNNVFKCDVCESLKGRYPKSFLFRAWHAQCRCHVVSILATDKEINELEVKMLNGDDTSDFVSTNQVKDMPAGWNDWMNRNNERLLRSKSMPYFITDNFKDGKIGNGLKFAVPKKMTATKDAPVEPAKGFVPEGLAQYEKKYGIEIDRQLFSKLKQDVPLTFSKKGSSHYSPSRKTVTIASDRRLERSKDFQQKILYHEYGHAVDWDNDLRKSNEVYAVMEKYQTQFRKNQSYSDLNQKWTTAFRKAVKENDFKGIEEAGSFADTLMSLNQNYGAGHTKKYFKTPYMKQAEFIAHAFENKFMGNSFFKETAPDLYDDMIKMIEEFLAKE
jgi:hypothetical protein